jgi:very-short-patch-repair endonuclease
MPPLDRFKRGASRRLRRDQTDWERRLWRHLWRIPIEGSHFRRQAPIGPYIVDFASHRLRLVIEIDGSQHARAAAATADRQRDDWLASQGYRVLRFWNHEVRFELDAILDTIYGVVEERRQKPSDR